MVRNKGKIALAVLCFNILTGVTTGSVPFV